MSIEMKNVMNAAGVNAQYDECAKHILGQKSILSWILANTVEEFRGMSPKDIIPLIEGNIQIGNMKYSGRRFFQKGSGYDV